MYDEYKQIQKKIRRERKNCRGLSYFCPKNLFRLGSNEASSTSTIQVLIEQQMVRTFLLNEKPPRQKLFWGVASLKLGPDKTFPTNIAVYAYKSSTTLEKKEKNGKADKNQKQY